MPDAHGVQLVMGEADVAADTAVLHWLLEKAGISGVTSEHARQVTGVWYS